MAASFNDYYDNNYNQSIVIISNKLQQLAVAVISISKCLRIITSRNDETRWMWIIHAWFDTIECIIAYEYVYICIWSIIITISSCDLMI